MSELIAVIIEAVRGGTVPRPAPQEPIEEFQFRCAHAGALVALAWASARSQSGQETAAEVTGDGATVAPLPVTPTPPDDDVEANDA